MASRSAISAAAVRTVLARLDAIAGSAGGGGRLELPGDRSLDVTNLRKPFWPSLGLTKGDLFRHYVRVAPFLLPVLADRPLVMKRYPNGVSAKPFYQHRAPDTPPPGIRIENVSSETEKRPHVIGGDLLTLMYTSQLASISQDPWFSRIDSQDRIDHVAIDLDPPDGLPFAKVREMARWVHEVLEAIGAPAFVKTSGSRGLHIYVPMPPNTPYEAGFIFGQIVAERVAALHPAAATTERAIAARGRRIYLDYVQNGRGKTLASAYSVRANEFAGVSTPLAWDELDDDVNPQDFTLATFAARIEAVGDLWAGLRTSKGATLLFDEPATPRPAATRAKRAPGRAARGPTRPK